MKTTALWIVMVICLGIALLVMGETDMQRIHSLEARAVAAEQAGQKLQKSLDAWIEAGETCNGAIQKARKANGQQ